MMASAPVYVIFIQSAEAHVRSIQYMMVFFFQFEGLPGTGLKRPMAGVDCIWSFV
jgi:hypothetical protein